MIVDRIQFVTNGEDAILRFTLVMTLVRTDPVGAAALVVVAALLLILVASSARVAFIGSLAAILTPLTIWSPSGFDTRLLALLAIGFQSLHLLSRLTSVRRHLPLDRRLTAAAIAFLVCFFLTTSFWASQPIRAIEIVGAWITLLFGFYVFARRLGPPEMIRLLYSFIAAVIMISCLFIVLGFPDAYAGGRARGIMFNANGLGILCALVAPRLLCDRRIVVRALVLIPVFLTIITASRAGFLALSLGMLVVVYRSRKVWLKLSASLLILAVIWMGIFIDWSSVQTSGDSLLRSNNSRADVWNYTLNQFELHPWLGIGAGSLDSLGGSSYFKLLAETGFVGALIGGVVLATLVRGVKPSVAVSGTLAAGLVNAAFESWLFAAGSFYCVAFFWLCLAAQSRELDGSPNDRLVHESSDSTVRTSSQPTR